MTRVFYFVGGLIALTLVFVAQSVVQAPAADTGSAAHAETAHAVAPTTPDVTGVAIDDLAAWPAAAAGR
jgi:hypothetical protein